MKTQVRTGNGGSRTHREPPVNGKAALTHRQLLAALRSFRRGEFSTRLPDDLPGQSLVQNHLVGSGRRERRRVQTKSPESFIDPE